MPRKFIDKKKATTFHLVHRSQRDPLINDPESSARVLKYVPPSNAKAGAQPITRESLEEDIDVEAVRANEGEAAEYGIYYDDTEYDYMQHLRSVGEAPDAVLLEAPGKDKGKGKAKEIVFGEKVPLLWGVGGLMEVGSAEGYSSG
jgi:protein LTV1